MPKSTAVAFGLGVFTAVWIYALAMLALAVSVSGHAPTVSGWSLLTTIGLSSMVGACVAAAFWIAGLLWFKTAPSRKAAFLIGVITVAIVVVVSGLLSAIQLGPAPRYLSQIATMAVIGFLAAGVTGRQG